MPRSRSSRPATAPAVVRPAPPPMQHQQPGAGGIMAGIGSTIAQGMAFGGGSAVAHRAVDAVVGPRTVTHEHVQVTQTMSAAGSGQSQGEDVCVNQAKAFKDCLKANANDIGKCQFYVDMLNECRKSAGEAATQSSGW